MADAFNAFERLATAELRAVFVVEFVASDGSLESGIDGGGLFKEFMSLGSLKEVRSRLKEERITYISYL